MKDQMIMMMVYKYMVPIMDSTHNTFASLGIFKMLELGRHFRLL